MIAAALRDAPTPIIAHSIRLHRASGGINITASHNPSEWNGLKFNESNGAPCLPETAKAIESDPVGVTSNGKKKALWVTRFDIDIAKCCYCGLCTFPCPTECIKMTDVFEFSEQERNNLIYSYITLTPEEITQALSLGSANARVIADSTLKKVKRSMGLFTFE